MEWLKIYDDDKCILSILTKNPCLNSNFTKGSKGKHTYLQWMSTVTVMKQYNSWIQFKQNIKCLADQMTNNLCYHCYK